MNKIVVDKDRLIHILEIFAEHVPCHNCPCNNSKICRNSAIVAGNYCDDGIYDYLTERIENK